MPSSTPLTRCKLLSIALAIFVGCQSDPTEESAKTPASPPYLKLLIVDDTGLAQVAVQLKQEWEAQVGGTFDVVEVKEKDICTYKPFAGDAIIYPERLLGVLAEKKWIRSLSAKWMENHNLDVDDLLQPPDAPDLCWDGQPYAISFGHASLMLCYRTDLLEQLGRNPPSTWAEYDELARLLHALPPEKAAKHITPIPVGFSEHWQGTAESFSPNHAAISLLVRAAPYARHRDYFSVLFNRETLEPLIDQPPFVRALEEIIDTRKEAGTAAQPNRFSPTALVLLGRAGMAIDWPLVHPWELEEGRWNAKVPIAFAPLPGSKEVFNPRSDQWENHREGEPTTVSVRAFGGRVGSVMTGSDHADAAFGLLAWLSTKPRDEELFRTSAYATPFRNSHVALASRWVSSAAGPNAEKQFFEVLESSLNEPNGISVPRILGATEYLAALDEAVIAAVEGKRSPHQALSEASQKWREITAKYGQDRQLAAYRKSLRAAE